MTEHGNDRAGSAAREEARAARAIGWSFAISALASLALAVVYLLGGQPQLEGLLLGIALGGVAIGLGLWAKKLLPAGPYVEARKLVPERTERAEAEASFASGARALDRRTWLLRMLGGALGALGIAALFPIRSLGQSPGRALYRTHWGAGARLVDARGDLLRPADLELGGVLTVFPENAPGEADSQTLLIRLDEDDYDPPPGREDWSVDGFVAFSKICTHAGCPVGLYQPETKELFCPCHQSVFDVLRAAEPTAGPATTPLPQLPLAIDEEGYLAATGDFSAPVGPSFWSRDRA